METRPRYKVTSYRRDKEMRFAVLRRRLFWPDELIAKTEDQNLAFAICKRLNEGKELIPQEVAA